MKFTQHELYQVALYFEPDLGQRQFDFTRQSDKEFDFFIECEGPGGQKEWFPRMVVKDCAQKLDQEFSEEITEEEVWSLFEDSLATVLE